VFNSVKVVWTVVADESALTTHMAESIKIKIPVKNIVFVILAFFFNEK
jgi:hypothetical protein